MKKWLMLLFVLCLFAGCNKQEDVAGDNGQEQIGQPTQAVGQPDATVIPGTGQMVTTDGDKILWTSYLGTRTYGREGSFYSENNRIYFLDAATGESDIICGDATCTHKREECSAYFDGVSYVALEGDHLLIVTTYGGDNGWDMQLYTADVDGSNRKHVAELGFMLSIYQVIFTEDKIIASFWNSVDENMAPMDENYAGIYVFDRKTNTGEVVWSKKAFNAIAAKLNYYNDVVYFDAFYFDVTMDEVAEYGQQSNYLEERKKYELCALDLTDKSVTVIQEGGWNTFSVCGGKVWFDLEEALWSYDIATGEKKKEFNKELMIEPSYGTDRLLARDAVNYYTYYTYTPDEGLVKNGIKNQVMASAVFPEITWAMNYNTPTGNGGVIYWDTEEFMGSGEKEEEATPTPTKAPAAATPIPTKAPATTTPIPTPTKEAANPLVLPEGVEVITWAMPDVIREEEYAAKLKVLNKTLLEEGYNYILEIKTFPKNKYREQVLPIIESGEADIISVGIDMANGSYGFAQDFIRKGYFEDLTEYLASEEGKTLWNWYTEAEWRKVETDGKNYVIPFQGSVYGSGYFAFNKSYVSEEMLKDFTGTPEDLKNILDSVELPAGVYGILNGMSYRDVAMLCGMTVEDDIFFDLETGVAENPFENEDYYTHMKMLNDLYNNGQIKEFTGLDSGTQEEAAVRNGKFAVWIDYRRNAFYEEVEDTVITVPMKFSMVNALSTCHGINKNSGQKESALQLLTLLYTDAVFGNLLTYGEEGTDYYLQDGFVCKPDGTMRINNTADLAYGIYDLAFPCLNDTLLTNRREFKNVHYASEYYVDSAVLGFQPDYTVLEGGVPAAVNVLTDYGAIWKEKNFDETWQKAAREFKDAGGEEMVAELNKQVKEWMKLYR